MQNKLIRYFVLSFLWFVLLYFKEGISNFIVFYLFALPGSSFSDAPWFFISIMLKFSLLLVLVLHYGLKTNGRKVWSRLKYSKQAGGRFSVSGNAPDKCFVRFDRWK